MKILFHYLGWNHPERRKVDGCSGVDYYRILKIAEQIKGHDVKVVGKEILHFGDSLEEQWDNVFKEYDVFWTSYFYDDRVAAAIFFHAQKHGKKVIIDLDDNYLDVPESNKLYDTFKEGKKERAFLSAVLSLADAITVSTEPLKERIFEHIKSVHGIEKPIFVLPNYNDLADWPEIKDKKPNDLLIIGYQGSNSHMDDLRMVMPSIAKVLNKHKNVKFDLIGIMDKKDLDKYFDGMGFEEESLMRIGQWPSTANFRDYPKVLAEKNWDIGIAPLVDTAFTRSKSHIKWMEYSTLKIPTIASRVYPYFMELDGKKTIEHGLTGLICKPNEWEANLEKLILDSELRRTLAENAHQFVKDNWQYKDSNINKITQEMLEVVSR